MLSFQRNKLVTISKEDDARLAIHGVLEDHIFGLELDVIVDMDALTIHAIEGKWNRQETPECHRAVPFLQEALGYTIDDPDFGRQINKMVGRKSCPHFANLLIECCDAALEAIQMLQWEAAKIKQQDLTLADYLEDGATEVIEEKPGCSTVSVESSAPQKTPAAPATCVRLATNQCK